MAEPGFKDASVASTASVAALILLWLAATAWARPLMLPDEGRYVGVAWEMLRSGAWLVPTLDGLPYFHKPPLLYWITAGSMWLFGLNEWAARAAPIFGAWLGAFAIYLFTRRWCSERAARIGVVVLLAQPLFYLGGQFANLDMLVAGFITATVLLLADAALCVERAQPCRRALAAAYAMAALGVLAKGLIGAVIPALVVTAWLAGRGRWRTLAALLWWPGVVVFVALVVPWFVMMQRRFDDFLDYFIVVQQFRRFAQSGFNNVQPFWFYPVLLLVLSLPGLPWLLRAVQPGPAQEPQQEPIRWLMVTWVATVVIFFSLPRSKLVGYVLPAVPPLAWLMVDGFASLGNVSARARRLWLAGVVLSASVGIGVVAVLTWRPLPSSRALGAVLAQQREPGHAVVMLGRYDFDLPFYARLREPMIVVDDWASAEVGKHDNWRKELADAGRFDPAAAGRVLILPVSLQARLCLSPVTWVVGDAADAQRYPILATAPVVVGPGASTLWRIDRAAPGIAADLRCNPTFPTEPAPPQRR